ncbi:isoaspartyl peptidase/L-asparaginase, partial [Methylobacterium organophilum]|nr:isoaspartyl peptidase/L-asparaginase [Methylobacterium organophilum]
MSDHRPVLVIHGGAGTIASGQADPGEARYHAALADILAAGAACLAAGGSALDAVGVAVDLLEECPLFNAGHGAVFTSAETHELDAAIVPAPPWITRTGRWSLMERFPEAGCRAGRRL